MNLYLDYHVDLDDLKYNTVRLRDRLDDEAREYTLTFRLTKLFNINKKQFQPLVMTVCEYILHREHDGWYTREQVLTLFDEKGEAIYSTIKGMFDDEMNAIEDKMGDVDFQHILKIDL